MNKETVIAEIYDMEINVTRVVDGIKFDDFDFKVDVVEEYEDCLVLKNSDNRDIKLMGELSYDEELGYVFTYGNIITYIEV